MHAGSLCGLLLGARLTTGLIQSAIKNLHSGTDLKLKWTLYYSELLLLIQTSKLLAPSQIQAQGENEVTLFTRCWQ